MNNNLPEYQDCKCHEELIIDALEKLVQLIDYQNKVLTDISNTLRKRK